MKFLGRVGMLLLLVSYAAAQGATGNAGEIKQVQVVRDGQDLCIEVTLSSATSPAVETAVNPDRLVLSLPNTVSEAKQKRIPVESSGVHAVRIGLNSANPPVTRVVVDLDSAHPYVVTTEGKKIVLRVQPGNAAVARRSEPAPAASAPLVGVFRRQQQEPVSSGANSAPQPIPPPASLPPLNLPANRPSGGASPQTATTAKPSPPHPKTGSLQQGTVYPGMGTPGAGVVPSTTAQTQANTFNAVAAAPQKSATPFTITVVGASSPSTVSSTATAKPATAPSVPMASTTTEKLVSAPQGSQIAASTGTSMPPAVPTSQNSAPVASAAPQTQPVASAPLPAAAAKVASSTKSAGSTATAAASAKAPIPEPDLDVTVSPGATHALSQTATVVPPPPAVAVTASSTSLSQTATVVPPPPGVPLTAQSTAINQAGAVVPPPPAVAVTANSTSLSQTVTVVPPPPALPVTAQSTSINQAGAVVPPPPTVAVTGKQAAINEAAKVVPPPPAVTVAQSEAINQIAAPVAGPPKPLAIPGTPGPAVNVASGPATAATDLVSSTGDAQPPAAEQPEAEVSASAVSLEVPLPALALRAAHPDFRTTFRVKYVAEGVAYLDGGRAAGLVEGMKLVVRETAVGDVAVAPDGSDPAAVAELDVTSVAETSAVTEIRSPKRDVKTGDIAYLSVDDEQALVQKNALSATRKYPTVISFTQGDTLDDEVRAEIPRPPLPSINRARGRIGVDYMGTLIHGSTSGNNTNLGLVARLDLTRIGGTYWTLSGYWRGRLNRGSYAGVDTIQDLLNRTYHLSLTYDNPASRWVAGVGRMYLPWATSLDTIDGGYFGARLGHGSTIGIFAGSTPDPTSWSYNPDRRIAGTFVNFEGGSWDAFRYTSTSGAGLSTIDWNLDRPFIFLENGIFYKRYLSFYDALQLDSPQGNAFQAPTGAGVGRNFTTVRFMPISRLEFDANYNYMRDLPTFDTNLIGTGLLDKYLFQGFNGGVRVEVLKQIWLYTSLGRGSRSGDTSSSLNELFGITFGHIPWLAVRADAHYSKFDSSFGSGYYGTFSLSRSLNDRLRIEILGGQQDFTSSYTADGRSRFVTGNIETNLGRHYFIQGGFTFSRGAVQNYDQWLLSLGYRFDSKKVGAQ